MNLRREAAIAQWKELKRKLKSGDIKFEEYAKTKRKLKKAMNQGAVLNISIGMEKPSR